MHVQFVSLFTLPYLEFFFFKYYYYSVGGEREWGEGYLELRVESGGKWTFLSQDITCVGAMRKGSEGGNRTRLGEISGGGDKV